MKKTAPLILILALAVPLVAPAGAARADEGMWLFTNPPLKLLKDKYGFVPPTGWFEHLQKSCVRFPGGSGSFVSPDGLVMTNHHVGAGAIQRLSAKGKDLLQDGYHAKTRGDELKCKAFELNVLVEVEDVTDQVKKAVDPKLSPEKAQQARQAIIAKIEKDSETQTKLYSNVVTLYQGNQYHLYRFKRYTDVRLVFAPEQSIAFFGGDADNFAYPRYDLDVTFFRVYENGKPAKTPDYLKWSKSGAKEDELVFVAGHPGKTDRLNTVAELEYLRDIGYPFLLQRLYRLEVMANIFSGRGEDYERKAKDYVFSVANSRKAREGGLGGLLDPAMMKQKKAYEKKLRDEAAQNTDLKDAVKAWDTIAKVQKLRAATLKRYNALEAGGGFNSSLFGYARTLVRAGDEFPKDNEKRLPEFSESNKKRLELGLFSENPIYPDFEQAKLADSLTWLVELLGYNDKLVQQVLAGKSPADRAGELINGTSLLKVAERKKLYAGGKDAVAQSDDPLIKLARLIDKEARAVRKTWDTQIDEVKKQAYDQVARVKFAVEGTNTYPDATFTLRLAFGPVKGYVEGGKKVPFETTFAGLYEKSKDNNNKPPYDLPKVWLDRKDKLNLKVPFNFVCTPDIIGGNSGSPVFNRKGEVVGLIFDGNIQSLVWDFQYTDEVARSVAVHSEGILEALRSIYQADELVKEITGK